MARVYPPTASDGRRWPPAAAAGSAMTVYTLGGIIASGDPNSIGNGNAVAGSAGEYVAMGLKTPGTIRLPNATDIGGSWVEWELKDASGVVQQMSANDLATIVCWILEEELPVDTYIGIALTAGGVGTIGNAGIFVAAEYDGTTSHELITMINAGAGAGWITLTTATAVDELTRGFQVEVGQGNATANTRTHALPLEAGGRLSSVSATVPAPQTGNTAADGAWTRIALVVGWSGIAGVGTPTLTGSIRTLISKIKALVNSGRLLSTPAPNLAGKLGGKGVILGDSNGNGTQVDATFSGGVIAATHPGWTFRDVGVNLANWPATGTPGTGIVPYLIDELIARGVTSGTRWIARRSTNGALTTWPGTIQGQLAGAFQDVQALGGGDPNWVLIIFGANDAQAAAEAGRFEDNYRRLLENIRAQWPDAFIMCVIEESLLGAGGTYPYLRHTAPVVATSIRTVAGEFGATVIDAAGLTHADDIHFSSNGTGSGQDALATLVANAIAA